MIYSSPLSLLHNRTPPPSSTPTGYPDPPSSSSSSHKNSSDGIFNAPSLPPASTQIRYSQLSNKLTSSSVKKSSSGNGGGDHNKPGPGPRIRQRTAIACSYCRRRKVCVSKCSGSLSMLFYFRGVFQSLMKLSGTREKNEKKTLRTVTPTAATQLKKNRPNWNQKRKAHKTPKDKKAGQATRVFFFFFLKGSV